MISKYLKFKNIIDQINPTINEEELKNDINNPYYHLKSSDQSSFYYYYRKLFDDYEIQKILAICDKLPKTEATLGSANKVDKSYRESTLSWVPVNNETHWIYQKLSKCINEVNELFFQYELTKIEKLQFTRYYGNQKGFYGPHIDSNFGHFDENRKLTFVMQLTDPREYEGGVLKLHFGRDGDCVEKEKGLITFFPSHVLHEFTPVISGTRCTLVGWIHGPKFK